MLVKNAVSNLIMSCAVTPALVNNQTVCHFFDGILALLSENLHEKDPYTGQWLS